MRHSVRRGVELQAGLISVARLPLKSCQASGLATLQPLQGLRSSGSGSGSWTSILTPLPGRHFGSEAQAESRSGTVPAPEVLSFLKKIRKSVDVDEEALQSFGNMKAAIQGVLLQDTSREQLNVLHALAALATIPGRPYPIAEFFVMFLETYIERLDDLADGETIADRAEQLREVLCAFHTACVSTERLKRLYSHIERDFPRYEAAGALLPMPSAVRLCHSMLATGLSSAPAVVVLLRSALREPLMHYTDDSQELRRLKMIEILLRVDFLHTQEQLPQEVTEYLSVVRSLRYYDPDLRRNTALSYQLAYFLRKHDFPAKRHMLGPYALKVCDPLDRINFEPVEDRYYPPGMVEKPPARKKRHLEAVGWRSIEVHASQWLQLAGYAEKAAHVRSLLKQHELLDP